MQPVMITAAFVGAEVTKAQQPYLPITPQEIVQAAAELVARIVRITHELDRPVATLHCAESARSGELYTFFFVLGKKHFVL